MQSGPWQNLYIDFHGPLRDGALLLVFLDSYSRYPVVDYVSSTSANVVIPKLDTILSSFGIPLVMKSDNGSPFNGSPFNGS
jgi:hypothetical protein